MGNRAFNLLTSIVVIAGITALVLPGRQSGAVITAGGTSFANILKAAQGR